MRRSRVFNIGAAAVILFACLFGVMSMRFKAPDTVSAYDLPAGMADSGLDYTESLAPVLNPDRGFYKALSYILPPAGRTVPSSFSVQSMSGHLAAGHGILHIEFGLESCSSNAYYSSGGKYVTGVTRPITEDMLFVIGQILQNVRESGQSAIIRFCYNVKGLSESDVGIGSKIYIDAEPSITQIQAHIQQLAPLFSEYVDVVSAVDAGFLGPWGEMHTTQAATLDNSVTVVDALLAAVPDSRTVMIRYPGQFAAWYNKHNGTAYTVDTMKEITVEPTSTAARIGMFNDGYLGSATDYGTYKSPTKNRANEATWVAQQTQRTFYGGECITDVAGGGLNDYNKIEFLAWEAPLTHTSHLNIDWNPTVIAAWKNTPYRVAPLANSYPQSGLSATLDSLYSGASATAFEFVQNRLGYRLVLRQAAVSTSVGQGGKVSFKGKIENVGFGNIVNEKAVYAVAKDLSSGTVYSRRVDVDVSSWAAGGGAVDFSFNFNAEKSGLAYPAGEYALYVKINDAAETPEFADTAFRTIRFANAGANMWDGDIGANYLGRFEIKEMPQKTLTFFDEDGETVLDTFPVPEGTVLSHSYIDTPDDKIKDGKRYVFAGWTDFHEGLLVYEDLSFTAIYERAPFFSVVFDGAGGNLISGETTQELEPNQAAVPPIYTREGYIFLGWDTDAYQKVTSNLTVTAIWKANPAPVLPDDPPPKGCAGSCAATDVTMLSILGLLLLAWQKGVGLR